MAITKYTEIITQTIERLLPHIGSNNSNIEADIKEILKTVKNIENILISLKKAAE
jgi:hypothetical protein